MTIARHTTFNIVGAVAPIVVALATVPLYIEAIGLDRYGILAICWLLLGYLNLFDLGLGRAAAQRIASFGEGQDEPVNRVFWNALAASAALAMVGAVILLLGGRHILEGMADPASTLRDEIAAAAPWLAATLPLGVIHGVIAGALEGRSRFLALNALNASTSVAGSIAPLAVAVWLGPELASLLAAAVLVRLASLLVGLAACWRGVPLSKPPRLAWRDIRTLLAFGGWATVSSVVSPLMVFFDRFAIGFAISAAAVAVYVIPFNLVAQLQILPGALASALSPRLAAATPEEARDLASNGLEVLVWALAPLTMVLLAAIGPFLHLWLGGTTGGAAEPVACLLLLGFWTNSLARIAYVQLHARGRPDVPARIHLAELLPYSVVLLLALAAFGVAGAALAWTLRATIDAALLTRFSGVRLPGLATALSSSLLVAAVAVCVLLPIDDPRRWLLLAPMLLAQLAQTLRRPPDRVGPLLAASANRLRLPAWLGPRRDSA